ncbi:hypothetical protein PQC07_gp083 [Aeromonas phage D3]|uniref:Uncharacterized protein n=2 Tax=Ludhianavirus TaxID=3044751 RepID=A0A514A1P4_9CAUD|nr:hypothetical protein PQC06_gp109 [Aeromonas phage LAh10]YP_010668673.1 hypothetical protein PQC07_gp083 [Aeromonas phage D3]QDH47204.1 hypothetical protein LAh10_109 [Aeromonas phage LAh10]QDJ96922.1 hypothetical protein D3_0192 [Aeromonas phage D3]QEP52228.1 hypothetical protein D9_0021 [Aeromonas phage D9]
MKPEVIGTTRHVRLFKHFVVKFPRMTTWYEKGFNLRVFLNNLYLNRRERRLAKKYKGAEGIPHIYFADPFGFVVVMKRYNTNLKTEQFCALYNSLLDRTEIDPEFWEDDSTVPNFGLTEDGKLVKIDLG